MEQEILQNTYNKKFHNALNKEEQKVPPIWLMRQAGRYHKHYRTLKEKYSFEQLCKEPELACEVTLGPIAEFDFDAAILFSDILFPLDYLGMGLKFKPGPIFERNLNSKMISEFNIDEFESFMEFQSKSLNLIRNELPNDKSLIGFTGGPFTLYHFAIRNNPVSEKLFQQTLPILEELIHKNIQIQFQSDIDLLMIFDTEANNLNDEEFDKLVIPAKVFTLAILFPTKSTLVIAPATVSISATASFKSLATVTTSAMFVATVLTEAIFVPTKFMLVLSEDCNQTFSR